jgi:hypothetical protein
MGAISSPIVPGKGVGVGVGPPGGGGGGVGAGVEVGAPVGVGEGGGMGVAVASPGDGIGVGVSVGALAGADAQPMPPASRALTINAITTLIEMFIAVPHLQQFFVFSLMMTVLVAALFLTAIYRCNSDSLSCEDGYDQPGDLFSIGSCAYVPIKCTGAGNHLVVYQKQRAFISMGPPVS